MVAAKFGSVDTARLLLQRGARIDAVDENNVSAWVHANTLKDEDKKTRMLTLLRPKEPK